MSKRAALRGIIPVMLLMISMGGALAAGQANQSINLEIASINELAITGNASLLINETTETGSGLKDAVDATTSYAVSTNQSNMKITAGLDTAMPAGLTLKVRLAAPAGAVSCGDVTLTTTAADVVTGISHLSQAGLAITYTLSATVAAGVVSTYRTVTFTLTAEG